MPVASCQPCLAMYSSSSTEVCRCHPSSNNCQHWRPHHAQVMSLCHSALIGCRLCRELWHYFFREKPPEEYAEEPWFGTGLVVHAYMNSGLRYRVVDMTGKPIERAAGPVAAMNDGPDDDPATILALCFALTSPMVLELPDRQFFLRSVTRKSLPSHLTHPLLVESLRAHLNPQPWTDSSPCWHRASSTTPAPTRSTPRPRTDGPSSAAG